MNNQYNHTTQTNQKNQDSPQLILQLNQNKVQDQKNSTEGQTQTQIKNVIQQSKSHQHKTNQTTTLENIQISTTQQQIILLNDERIKMIDQGGEQLIFQIKCGNSNSNDKQQKQQNGTNLVWQKQSDNPTDQTVNQLPQSQQNQSDVLSFAVNKQVQSFYDLIQNIKFLSFPSHQTTQQTQQQQQQQYTFQYPPKHLHELLLQTVNDQQNSIKIVDYILSLQQFDPEVVSRRCFIQLSQCGTGNDTDIPTVDQWRLMYVDMIPEGYFLALTDLKVRMKQFVQCAKFDHVQFLSLDYTELGDESWMIFVQNAKIFTNLRAISASNNNLVTIKAEDIEKFQLLQFISLYDNPLSKESINQLVKYQMSHPKIKNNVRYNANPQEN